MYNEFFEEMQSGMLPFIDAKTYGRSPVECSSFIASSAFVDPANHGRGFLPRLSGSTAEFLSIWSLMFIGQSPFFINYETGLVEMQLKPVLPSWLILEDKFAHKQGQRYYVEFKLFTSIKVTYFIEERKHLFRVIPKKYEIGLRDGSIRRVDRPVIPNDLALMVRRVVQIDHINVFL